MTVFVLPPTQTQAAAAKHRLLFRRKIAERAALIQPILVNHIIPEPPQLAPDPQIPVITLETSVQPPGPSILVFPIMPKKRTPTLAHPIAIAIIYPDSLRRRKIACLTMAGGFCSMHDSGRVSFARGSS